MGMNSPKSHRQYIPGVGLDPSGGRAGSEVPAPDQNVENDVEPWTCASLRSSSVAKNNTTLVRNLIDHRLS
jgi:hypothetical protein